MGMGQSEGYLFSTEPVHYGNQLIDGYKKGFYKGINQGITGYRLILICIALFRVISKK